MLLSDAKNEMFKKAYNGTNCPCCDQRVQVYRRTITSAMAYGLILVDRYFHYNSEWLHIPSFFAGLPLDSRFKATLRGDFAKLRYWGFVGEKEEAREDGSGRNGNYRITFPGREFVFGRIAAAKYAYVYNQKLLGMTDGAWAPANYITIAEALGQKFNYTELMKGAP